MTYSRGRGHASGHHDASNVVDLPQEAALIRDLRRLQKHLEHERSGERERFPHATEVRPTNSCPDKLGGAGSKTPDKSALGAVGRLLGALGLDRPNSVTGPKTHSKQAAFARESARVATAAPSHTRPEQKAEGIAPSPSTIKKIHSGRAQAAAHHSAGEPWRVSLHDRIGTPPPAKARSGLRPNSTAMPKPARAFDHLRAALAFLVSRAGAVGFDDGSELPAHRALSEGFRILSSR